MPDASHQLPGARLVEPEQARGAPELRQHLHDACRRFRVEHESDLTLAVTVHGGPGQGDILRERDDGARTSALS